jgi:hypothetical protein
VQQGRPKATRALFLGVALTAITVTLVASLNPKNYFFYRLEDRDKWTYPLAGVALILAFILLETAFTYLLFTARRPRLLWIRALLGLLILGPWGFFVAMWVVHAPMFYLLHIAYVWLLIAITALALVVSLAQTGGRWLLTRMPKQT